MKGLTQEHIAGAALLVAGSLLLLVADLLPWGYVGVLWISGFNGEALGLGILACVLALAALGSAAAVLFIDTRPWARRAAGAGAVVAAAWLLLLPGVIHTAARVHAGFGARSSVPVSSGAGAYLAAFAIAVLFPGYALVISGSSRSRNWMAAIPIGLAIAVYAALRV